MLDQSLLQCRLVIVGDTHGQLADVRNQMLYLIMSEKRYTMLHRTTGLMHCRYGGTTHPVSFGTSQCPKQAGSVGSVARSAAAASYNGQ